MPHYRIELTPQRGDKPGGNGVTDREERRFANLGEALDRAREMHRWQNASARKTGPTPYAYWKRRGARR
jgi:hypothetical protein